MIKVRPQEILPDIRYFGRYVMNRKNRVSNEFFSDELGRIERQYIKYCQEDTFCIETDKLADKLFKTKNFDFVGIIMSTLCKLNEGFPHNLEYFALKGYGISRRNGDYVHMMARLNDLRKVYIGKPDRLYDYLNVLYAQEYCLQKLAKNYNRSIASFRTVRRPPAPKSSYEQMLAYVRVEISKLIRRKHPDEAMQKLSSALRVLKGNDKKGADYARLLIRKIESGSEDYIDMNSLRQIK